MPYLHNGFQGTPNILYQYFGLLHNNIEYLQRFSKLLK